MAETPVNQSVKSGPTAGKDQTPLVGTSENKLEILQQGDGQTVCPPAAETSTSESQWAVGAPCRAAWSEDGLEYPATVASVDGERCRVRFNIYDNEEDVELSTLKRAPPTQNTQDWSPGCHCRAEYSEDGLVYPAVVLWVKGQRCRVRYNNEEEQDVSGLLKPDELHGPNRATAKLNTWTRTTDS